MSEGLNRAEQFVCRISQKSFLSLWSYANPRGKEAGKELCDMLVVCDPHVIVFSVKDITLRETRRPEVGAQRWYRAAIDESVKQAYGASRWLERATHVIRNDGTLGLPIPPAERRKTHLIAVACGGRGQVPVPSGDFGKGYVHVMTEDAFGIILQELDTISDLVAYLIAKEDWVAPHAQVLMEGDEPDLLAHYLMHKRSLPPSALLCVVASGIWDDFVRRPEVKRKRDEDRMSYVWDGLIELLSPDILHERLESRVDLAEAEAVVREMASENRFARRLLGGAFYNFMANRSVGVRTMPSPSGVVYLFMRGDHQGDRSGIQAELQRRCFLLRGMFRDSTTVVGLALDTNTVDGTESFTVCRLCLPEWTESDQQDYQELRAQTKAFQDATFRGAYVQEYPT